MHHSVGRHGGTSLLDCASANVSSESQNRADIVCLVLLSSLALSSGASERVGEMPDARTPEDIAPANNPVGKVVMLSCTGHRSDV